MNSHSRPRLRRRASLAFAAASLGLALLVVGTWTLARDRAVRDYAETRAAARDLASDNTRLARTNQELEREVARLQRALEISDGARSRLREGLSRQHVEIDGLRSDLAFYQGLIGQAGDREGLGAHRVRVEPTSSPAVFRLSVTLSQNLKRAKTVSGAVQLSVEGVFEDYPEKLPWAVVNAGAPVEGLPFSFKYFQEVDGTITLPPGFAPERLLVLVNTAGTLEQIAAVDWRQALNSSGADRMQDNV